MNFIRSVLIEEERTISSLSPVARMQSPSWVRKKNPSIRQTASRIAPETSSFENFPLERV